VSRPITREEHPVSAVALHWVHLVSLGALVFTGLEIHELPPQLWNLASTSRVHGLVAGVFLMTFLTRFAWAFLSDGSASKGSTTLVGDWRHFGYHRGDVASAREWLGYYTLRRKGSPGEDKYNPLQRGVYVILFPLMILWMLLTGLALWPGTSIRMAPFTNLVGGAQAARLGHYDGMVLLIALCAVHLYAALLGGWPTIANMFLCWVPRANRPDPIPVQAEPALADGSSEHLGA